VPKAIRTTDWDRVLSALIDRLTVPSEIHPSVRWISETRLKSLLIAVRDDLDIAGKATLTGGLLLEGLCQSGLAHALEIADVPPGQKPLRIYRVGMGGSHGITPLELLQAVKPGQVACYFSALEFHELTTQVAPHHHTARLEAVIDRGSAWMEPGPGSALPGHRDGDPSVLGGSTRRDRALGTLLFHHEGVPYYCTRRDRALVPAVQWVYVSAETMVHITSLEQTLLDTLHRPWICGGPAVVYEAWERGAARLQGEGLAACLRAIDRPTLCRRVGYMLNHCGCHMDSPALADVLRNARESAAVEPMLPLLMGVPWSSIDSEWNVGVPG